MARFTQIKLFVAATFVLIVVGFVIGLLTASHFFAKPKPKADEQTK